MQDLKHFQSKNNGFWKQTISMCNTKVWWYIGVEITKFEISCHHTSCKFWIGPFHQQPHLVLKFIFLFYHQYVQYILSLGLWSWIKGKGNKSLKEKNPEWILLSNPQLWHFGMLWYQLYLGLHNVNMKNTWYPQKIVKFFCRCVLFGTILHLK